MSQIIPTAEPFFFPGKGENARIGCLVQHGFTGAPKEVRWLGEYLNAQGYTVCGMRLAGHATQPDDMIRMRYTNWMASVEDGYHILRGATDMVFFLGLSMGGVLSLTMASRLPACTEQGLGVKGVVAMSTPYKLPDNPLMRFIRPLSWLVPYMAKSKDTPGTGWFDKDAYKQHVAYPKNPVRSAAELNDLLAVMRASLPQVKVPVLLIHSRDDHYVVEGSMDTIYEQLGSADKQKLWVEGGGHVITEEPTRTVVFKAAADFVARVSRA
jgi:carboxylesterase